MPLESRNIRNLKEEPLRAQDVERTESARRLGKERGASKEGEMSAHLSRLVLEARLVESDLHSSSRVKHDFDDISLPSSSNLSVDSLSEVLEERSERGRIGKGVSNAADLIRDFDEV